MVVGRALMARPRPLCMDGASMGLSPPLQRVCRDFVDCPVKPGQDD